VSRGVLSSTETASCLDRRHPSARKPLLQLPISPLRINGQPDMASREAKFHHHPEADGNHRTVKLPMERMIGCGVCSTTAEGGQLKLCSRCGEVMYWDFNGITTLIHFIHLVTLLILSDSIALPNVNQSIGAFTKSHVVTVQCFPAFISLINVLVSENVCRKD